MYGKHISDKYNTPFLRKYIAKAIAVIMRKVLAAPETNSSKEVRSFQFLSMARTNVVTAK